MIGAELSPISDPTIRFLRFLNITTESGKRYRLNPDLAV